MVGYEVFILDAVTSKRKEIFMRKWPLLVAVRFKTYFYSRSIAAIADSNSAVSLNICLLFLLRVV
jgi:hypothetical protein